jgi:hypothetical protein
MSERLVVGVLKKVGNEYCVFSEDGEKKLGCYPTREEALKRLRQVEFFKKSGASADEEASIDVEYSLDDLETVDGDDIGESLLYFSDGTVLYNNRGVIERIEDPGFEFEQEAE